MPREVGNDAAVATTTADIGKHLAAMELVAACLVRFPGHEFRQRQFTNCNTHHLLLVVFAVLALLRAMQPGSSKSKGEMKKPLQNAAGAWIFWLLDLGSNQGPTD